MLRKAEKREFVSLLISSCVRANFQQPEHSVFRRIIVPHLALNSTPFTVGSVKIYEKHAGMVHREKPAPLLGKAIKQPRGKRWRQFSVMKLCGEVSLNGR